MSSGLPAESGHCSIRSACLKRANKRLMHRSKTTPSFDHLVDPREWFRRFETGITSLIAGIAFVATLNYDVPRGNTVSP
jgi:hypothetical protein